MRNVREIKKLINSAKKEKPGLLTSKMKHLLLVSCSVWLWSSVWCARDPYTRIEAESMDVNGGAEVTADSGTSGGKYASSLGPGDHIGFKQLNFSVDTAAFEFQLYNDNAYSLHNQVLLRLDAPTSAPFLTLVVPHANGHWIPSTTLIPVDQRPQGVHDLYLKFQYTSSSGHLVHIDWFRFITLDSLLPPTHTLCPLEPTCPSTVSTPHTCHKQVVINVY